MKEQSGVDFLHSKILFNIGLDDNDIFKLRELVKIAKKLENKQHGKTWDTALDNYEVRAGNYMRAYGDFDDYFNETYESKESDDHIVEANKMVNKPQIILGEHSIQMVEISDEEIIKLANEYILYNDSKRQWVIEGMKLYREQLKKK